MEIGNRERVRMSLNSSFNGKFKAKYIKIASY
jgi:hypothetical protein